MNYSTITLRPAQTHDAERLIDIHYASVQHISEVFYPREILNAWSPTPSPQRHQWMRDTIQSSERIVWVAQHDSEISAFAIASPADGFIHALYVDPKFSGLGIGKQLLKKIECLLLNSGIRTAQLKASKNAAAFYQSVGYEPLTDETQPLSDGSIMACILMKKTLS